MLGQLLAAAISTSPAIYLLYLFDLIDLDFQSCSIGDYSVGEQGAQFAVEGFAIVYYLGAASHSFLCPCEDH